MGRVTVRAASSASFAAFALGDRHGRIGCAFLPFALERSPPEGAGGSHSGGSKRGQTEPPELVTSLRDDCFRHGLWTFCRRMGHNPHYVRSEVIECDFVPDHFVPIRQTCKNLHPLWNLRNFETWLLGLDGKCSN